MGFSISGYVLEPPRVGQSNSPFTGSPNTFISNQGTFDTAYPSDESEPRNDYLVLVTSEGWVLDPPASPQTASGGGLLENVGFGWTKNEVVQRFDYAAAEGRFKTLPGGEIANAGVLGADSNTERLVVLPPLEALPEAPYRLFLGTPEAPVGFTVLLISSDAEFDLPVPPPGSVQLSQSTGNLNWNPADLGTYDGFDVRWQQQQFFAFTDSTGRIGVLAPSLTVPIPGDPLVLLNPIPGAGQTPLIRIGYSFYLDAVEVANAAGFTAFPGPVSGTVEWARDTGTLNFNNADATTFAGLPVYYDGVLFAESLSLPTETVGAVDPGAGSPPVAGTLATIPEVGSDFIFVLPTASPYYRFPQVNLIEFAADFDSTGVEGVVQVALDTGEVLFSLSDRARFGSVVAEFYSGDLPIENGHSIRLFRSAVNLDAGNDVKDVTAIYGVEDAIWAQPIVGAPEVYLPSVPIDDSFYSDLEWVERTGLVETEGRLDVFVEQGQGTYRGPLNRLDTAAPPAGLGYFINFDSRTFNYAERKNDEDVPITSPGAAYLPDPLVFEGNVGLELESSPGSGVYNPLTDYLFEPLSGLVTFTNTFGVVFAEGVAATFNPSGSNGLLTDPAASFLVNGVQPGDLLVVQSTAAKGVYTVTAVTATTLTTDVQPQTPDLTDPPVPVSVTNAAYSVQRRREVMADRYFQEALLLDPTTQVERIRTLGLGQNATSLVTSQPGTFPDFTSLEDLGTDFLAAGVLIGDSVEVTTGPNTGVRVITFVEQNKLTVSSSDPFVDLGTPPTTGTETYSVFRRLRVPLASVGTSRFRFGDALTGTFSGTVVQVPVDSGFGTPVEGTVEISQSTGNLNFNPSDIAGVVVYWVNTLAPKLDYKMLPGLGQIEFTDRLLSLEEVLVTYTTEPPSTSPPTEPAPPQTEYATFIVRKEVTADHPAPTSTLSFNPLGRPVANLPAPEVFRGGRPQQTGVQVNIDTAASTITFLPDDIVTDALPHGATVGPEERVYIDYYVLSAIGGEQTTTVLNPPILTAEVVITEGTNEFTAHFDQTGVFKPDHLLRIESEEVYLIGNVSYDAGEDLTTVTLAGTQVFQNSYDAPQLYVSSGVIRTTTAPFQPSYFVPELQAFEPVARGMNRLFILGDRASSYRTGTVIYATDIATSFTDYMPVTGSKYDPDANKTEVTLATNALRQYVQGSQILQHSVRPIFEDGVSEVQTGSPPVLTQDVDVYRRKEGDAGLLLASPTDYTINDSGVVSFTTPLLPGEEFSILYTAAALVTVGTNLRASYTYALVPNETNGLLGQVLVARGYTIFSPDNFYYRVEPMGNFRGEVALEIAAEATASAPSSGPATENSSTPRLFEQGRESAYFSEGHLSNQDIIARSTLKWYNDAVNHLEDVLQNYDGRVVGNNDGRFLFDGTTGTLNGTANQIDDTVKISDAPYKLEFPPFVLTSIGTYQRVYIPSAFSRFFPTAKNFFAVTAAGFDSGTEPETGQEVADAGSTDLTSIANLRTRMAWAKVTTLVPAGQVVIPVDTTLGTQEFYRPPFQVGSGPNMKVLVQDRDGTFIADLLTPLEITALAPTQITVSSGALVDIPAGATIYRSPLDDSAQADPDQLVYYQLGRDYNYNPETGQILYMRPFPPLDGSVPAIPAELEVHPFPEQQFLSGALTLVNTKTEPCRVSMMDGGTADDDGDVSFPVQSPSPDSEFSDAGGFVAEEFAVVSDGTPDPPNGTIRDATTPVYVGTGTLGGTTVITDSVPYLAPVPKQYDLVRILTGANAGSQFRRVISATPNSVTVAEPFVVDGSPFTYEVTVAVPLIQAVFPGIDSFPTATTLDYLAGGFSGVVEPGQTIIFESGGDAGERRQIVEVVSDTVLEFDQALPASFATGLFHVDNSLATYGGTPNDQLTRWENALIGQQGLYATNPGPPPDTVTALENFFDTVFTDLLVDTNGSTTTGSDVFTGGPWPADLAVGHYIYIRNGGSQGIWQIAEILTSTTLRVTENFPATLGSISYRAVEAFGVANPSLQTLFQQILDVEALSTGIAPTLATVQTNIGVLRTPTADVESWATDVRTALLDTRDSATQARIGDLTDPADSPVAEVERVLATSDRLYDGRFVWVDARINLQSGLLVLATRAVGERIQAQEDTLKQLTKLLAVEGA